MEQMKKKMKKKGKTFCTSYGYFISQVAFIVWNKQ